MTNTKKPVVRMVTIGTGKKGDLDVWAVLSGIIQLPDCDCTHNPYRVGRYHLYGTKAEAEKVLKNRYPRRNRQPKKIGGEKFFNMDHGACVVRATITYTKPRKTKRP
jgi:hypothetical protein